jgi:TANK-binding kinase 1
VRDRAARALTYNDEQFHALERVKVTEAGRAARALLERECNPAACAIAEALEDWFDSFFVMFFF